MKTIMCGAMGVGKTSFALRFTKNTFTTSYHSTIGVDFHLGKFQASDGTRVRLQIWDLAGQERFRSVTDIHFRNSLALFFIYDVTDKGSFEQLTHWLDRAKWTERKEKEGDGLQGFLIGNKIDLQDKMAVKREDAKRFAFHYHLHFMETSAMTGELVEESFALAVDNIVKASKARVRAGKKSLLVRDETVVKLATEEDFGLAGVAGVAQRRGCCK